MGQFNRSIRNQQMFIEDYPKAKIYPLNCVPNDRPNRTWTKGTKAWKKATPSEPAMIVGWFTPPRFKKGKSLDRGSFMGMTFDSSEE